MQAISHGAAIAATAAATPSPPRVIAIVGGGFSGTCLAIQLLRHAGDARLDIRLIEPRESPGAGIAYATRDFPYPLNVAAERMSIDASAPDDFLAFARTQGIDAAPGDYLPRQFYGEYLRTRFAQACRDAPQNARATHHRARAMQLRRTADGRFELWLDDGSALRADEVVLALGNPPPATLDEFLPIASSPHYVDDPWSIGGRNNMESVLLVGSGLTMVDVALRLAAIRPRPQRIHVLSRHGLLPEPQKDDPRPGVKPDFQGLEPARHSTRALLRELRRLVDAAHDAGGDWRTVLNALRPAVPGLWAGLGSDERGRFLRHLRPYWEVHRHRVPAGALAAVRNLERIGVLEVHAGRLESLRPLDDSVEVVWRPRGQRRRRACLVDLVVNCTGPDSRLAMSTDPLIRSLQGSGSMRPDAHALGLDVGEHGEVIARGGEPVRGLYYLGPWLRARDWEATAVPELREHASRLARRLIDSAGEAAGRAGSRLPAR